MVKILKKISKKLGEFYFNLLKRIYLGISKVRLSRLSKYFPMFLPDI